MTRRGVGLALLLVAGVAPAGDFALRGEVGAETRYFFHDPADSRQADADFSLRLLPELQADWNDRDTSLTLTPFARLDSSDRQRTHWDVREAYLRHRYGEWEARAGIRKVFWGAAESVHLVDIINQTDLVENPDGEDKLGQPMLNLAWTADGNTLDLFVLPYFRERSYPGTEGRLRFVLPVSDDRAVYESADEERHLDWAVRYAYSGDGLDLALSHFSGTARAPRFVAGPGGIDPFPPGADSRLVPFYDLVERSGLESTLVAGGWLFKLEGAYQHSRLDDYSAAVGGFEYTLTGVFDTATDIGLLAEYIWDERGRDAPTPFNNDVFLGTRVAANDVSGTELLAGAIIDADTQAVFYNIEAGRRLGGGFKITLEARLFERAPPADPAFAYRFDDYVGLELSYFF